MAVMFTIDGVDNSPTNARQCLHWDWELVQTSYVIRTGNCWVNILQTGDAFHKEFMGSESKSSANSGFFYLKITSRSDHNFVPAMIVPRGDIRNLWPDSFISIRLKQITFSRDFSYELKTDIEKVS